MCLNLFISTRHGEERSKGGGTSGGKVIRVNVDTDYGVDSGTYSCIRENASDFAFLSKPIVGENVGSFVPFDRWINVACSHFSLPCDSPNVSSSS